MLTWPAIEPKSIEIRFLVVVGGLNTRPSVEVPMNGRRYDKSLRTSDDVPTGYTRRPSTMRRVEEKGFGYKFESMNVYHGTPSELRFCIFSAIIRVAETMSLCSFSWILCSNISMFSSTPLIKGISSTYRIVRNGLGRPDAKQEALTHK